MFKVLVYKMKFKETEGEIRVRVVPAFHKTSISVVIT